jgi:hypothetical protein
MSRHAASMASESAPDPSAPPATPAAFGLLVTERQGVEHNALGATRAAAHEPARLVNAFRPVSR